MRRPRFVTREFREDFFQRWNWCNEILVEKLSSFLQFSNNTEILERSIQVVQINLVDP